MASILMQASGLHSDVHRAWLGLGLWLWRGRGYTAPASSPPSLPGTLRSLPCWGRGAVGGSLQVQVQVGWAGCPSVQLSADMVPPAGCYRTVRTLGRRKAAAWTQTDGARRSPTALRWHRW